jgi:DNA-binding transcriptional regulator YhcF (GntR family)
MSGLKSATHCYVPLPLLGSAAHRYPLERTSVQLSTVLSMEIRPDAYAWQQVAAEIKRRIESGQYRPGMPIPSERRMAEEMGVAISTIRRAVGALRDEDVLRTLPAKGTYVVDRQADE